MSCCKRVDDDLCAADSVFPLKFNILFVVTCDL